MTDIEQSSIEMYSLVVIKLKRIFKHILQLYIHIVKELVT